jgi:hypothetical protein
LKINKIKPRLLTKKEKKEMIKSLEILAKKYELEAEKKQGRKKRVMIPFELEVGNFCCARLHQAFKESAVNEFRIFWAVDTYIIHLTMKNFNGNYCPYCNKNITEFFYIKEY